MSSVLSKGPVPRTSPIGVVSGASYRFNEAAWADAEDVVADAVAPTVRDTSRFVSQKRNDAVFDPSNVFLSATFPVALTDGRHVAPAIPIRNIAVLYQESITRDKRSGEPSDYARTYLRIGVHTSLVTRLAESVRRQGIHLSVPPIHNSIEVGVFTVFVVNIDTGSNPNVRVGYTKDVGGKPHFQKTDDLVAPLSKGEDFEAHALLALKAKYSGVPLPDWKRGVYSLTIEPQLISITSNYQGPPMAPNITGSAAPKAESVMPSSAIVGGEFEKYYFL